MLGCDADLLFSVNVAVDRCWIVNANVTAWSACVCTFPNPVELYVLFVQQSDTDQVPSGPSYVVVVAIDFGTTSSGYAYAFTKEPECIHTMR